MKGKKNWYVLHLSLISSVVFTVIAICIFIRVRTSTRKHDYEGSVIHAMACGHVYSITNGTEPMITSYLNAIELINAKNVFDKLNKITNFPDINDLNKLNIAHKNLIHNMESYSVDHMDEPAREYVREVKLVCDRH